MNSVLLSLRWAALAVLLTVLAGTARSAGMPDGPAMVGEATLVIGVAKLTSADGMVRTVERGTAVRVGDRIETAAGGHVHLRFVDGARLSVRPSSRLQVENYNLASDQGALTAIKFRLDEGVVRSITGAWGEAERDRFRLNTPVAAIGVKGTDFVVKSDSNTTLASVYSGAITLTPLAGLGCQSSLGPCLNGSEKLLSADMRSQMLSLSREQATPQLVPAADLMAQRLVRPAPAEAPPKSDYALKTDANPAGNRPDSAIDKTVVSEVRVVDMVTIQVAAAQPLPPPVVGVPPPLSPEVDQLAWARLAAVAADGDIISRSFAQAKQNGRQGTVGNGAYSLYREVSGTEPVVLASADTSASFRLAGSSAQLAVLVGRSTVSEAVQVNKGTLNVDFAHATYATQLDVFNTRIGFDNVVSSGVIKPNGVLLGQGGNAYTAGALSLDGKEAGYFFEKTLAAGQLTGITQWGR